MFLFLTQILALLLSYMNIQIVKFILTEIYMKIAKLKLKETIEQVISIRHICLIYITQLLLQNMHEHISSDRLISHHRTREDYNDPPQNSLTFGYGDHRYVKFTYELLRQSDILKVKILKQLIEDFSACQSIDLALKSSDLLSVLLKHIKNKDNDQIRSLSIKVIRKICKSQLGKRIIMKKNCILEIQVLINDKLNNIREQTYDALLDFAQNTDGIEEILNKNSILTDLVDKLIQQKVPQILCKTVQLIANLMHGEQGTPKALKTQIIARLMNILDSSNSQIQVKILTTLANISFNYDGKEQIIAKGHIKSLCQYVTHKDSLVRRQTCLLLCSLAQLNQGKIEILNFCPFQSIVARLDDPLSDTVLNAVQLIANIAEHPLGRTQSLNIVSKIQKINCIERKYVDATLEVIRWKP